MKRTITLIFFTCMVLTKAFSQQPVHLWTKQLTTVDFTPAWDFNKTIVTDASGNLYSTGVFYGTVDFDPGVGVFNLTSAGYSDVFIQKLDASGNFIWAKRIGNNLDDMATAIAISANGFISLCGSFNTTVDFDPDAGVFNLTSPGPSSACYVLTLNTNGGFQWAKAFGCTNFGDFATSIAVDNFGNVYTAGDKTCQADFDPGPGVFNLSPVGHMFIQKLDAAGNFQWAITVGSTSLEDFIYSLATDQSGNVFATGTFAGTADFDPGVASYNLTAVGNKDIFILKLNANGSFAWAKKIGSSGQDFYGNSIVVGPSGNVYSTGIFGSGTIDFDPGPGVYNLISAGFYQCYFLKLNNSGDFVWAKSIYGSGGSLGYSITTDNAENIYAAGRFAQTSDFDPGPANYSMNSIGNDMFIEKLDSVGNFVYALQCGGSLANVTPSSIQVDISGDIYCNGIFSDTVDFDPGQSTFNLIESNNTSYNGFIQKLSQCGNPPATVTASGPLTFCQGQSVTLNANSYPGATYQWYKNGVAIAGATSISYGASLTGNYKVGLTSGACSAVFSSESTITHTFITASVSSNTPITLCNGGIATLQATTGAGYLYQWNFNGTPVSGATASTYQASAGGLYSVKITDPQSCYNVSSNFAIVTNLATASITSSRTNPVCGNNSIVGLFANATGLNITGYQWKFNGAVINGETGSSYVLKASPATAGSYTVDVINDCGVFTSAPYVLTVTTISIPVVTSVGNNFFCNTGSVTLSTASQSGLTYQWYNQNMAVVAGATASSYTTTTAGGYYVIVSGPNGCYMTSNTMGVYSTGFGPSISPSNIRNTCSPVLLTASPSSGVTYQWYRDGSLIAGATASTYNAITDGAYSCAMTGACGSATATLSYFSFLTFVYPQTISSPVTSSCGAPILLTSSPNYTSFSYQWRLNGVDIPGATSNTYSATSSGSYTCFLTQPCGTNTSNSIALTFNPVPSAIISALGITNLCNGASVTLNANTGTGLSYQWTVNGNIITGATSASYTTSNGGTYRCIVTGSGGCSATSGYINVFAGTIPPSTITPAGPTTVCSGSVVLNANTGTGLSYQWKNNNVNIAGATGASYTASASGSYTVVVTATGGCSATSAATVVTIGAMSAAVTPSGTVTLCSGTSTTLSATAGTGYTYQWYRNNVLLSTTTQTFTTSTQGTYKCVVTSGSCTATSNSVVIVVNTTPAATATYSTPLSFCSPGSVTFTANALSGASYQWENNSVAIAGATAQTYTATTAGAYRIKETKNGCTGYSSVKTVTSATSVTAAITTADPTTQCTGGTVNMSITSPIPGYSYQWKNNTVNIAGATANTYAATATGNYTVTATASCGTATSNVIAVTIGTLSAVVTPTGNATLCNGGSLTLTANTGSGYGYQWKKNNVNIAGATASTYIVTTAGSYTVAITSPCGNATSVATVVSQAGTVTAAVTPAGSSTVCSGSSITFTANTGTGYTYKWYRNNVLLTATTQTYTTGTAGSYKVEVSISGSCAVQSNTVTLTVINNPTPTVTAGGPTTFCAGQSVTFTANTYAGVVQQWQKNSVNIAGATAATYIATTAGSYRVQQTANGCSKFSSKKTVTVNCRLGQNGEELYGEETVNAITMDVYPNPFADKLNIEITSPVTEQTEIKVMDVLGKVQYAQTITTNKTTELNTQLPAGIYMINAFVDGKMKTQRVVKTK